MNIGDWSLPDEMEKKLDEACLEISKQYNLAHEGLVREQIAGVISQALQCGDLQITMFAPPSYRVTPEPDRIGGTLHYRPLKSFVDYVPGRGIEQARAQIAALKKENEELRLACQGAGVKIGAYEDEV